MSENLETKVSLDESYKVCRKIARQRFGNYAWTVGNLSRDQRRHVEALAAFLAKSIDLLDTQVSPIARREEWTEWRDAVRNAFRSLDTEPELLALADTAEKFEIPREYFFDVQAGVEMGLRCEHFEAFDQWMQLASRIGGSMMLAAVPVLGFDEEGYEEAAMACGEAIYLTQLIDEMGSGYHRVMHFAPRMEARACEVELESLNPKKPGKEFARFVRRLIGRIEPLFVEGGKLVRYMSFDGKRVMRTLIAAHWQLLLKMKVEPEGVFQNAHQLTRRDMFNLRFKHLMGLEGGVPVIDEGDDHHGH